MEAIVNASFSVLNVNTQYLENRNGTSLARSEDDSNLVKVLDKSPIQPHMSKKRLFVFDTSGEGDVCNQIHFCLIYLYPLTKDNMTQEYLPLDHKMTFLLFRGQMLIVTPW